MNINGNGCAVLCCKALRTMNHLVRHIQSDGIIYALLYN